MKRRLLFMENHQEHEHTHQDALERITLLQELKQAEAPEQEESYFQLVLVLLDDKVYGIRILAVREILKWRKITWLPCVPTYILGVISVRGDIQSVVNLKNLLQLGNSEITEHSRIILIESGELIAGLLVDEMIDIVNIPESAIFPFTETGMGIVQRYIEGKVKWNYTLVTLLNIETILQSVVVNQI